MLKDSLKRFIINNYQVIIWKKLNLHCWVSFELSRIFSFTSVLISGLGDSNYSTFQGAPRKLEKQFLALGATPLLPRGEADDQVGFVTYEI